MKKLLYLIIITIAWIIYIFDTVFLIYYSILGFWLRRFSYSGFSVLQDSEFCLNLNKKSFFASFLFSYSIRTAFLCSQNARTWIRKRYSYSFSERLGENEKERLSMKETKRAIKKTKKRQIREKRWEEETDRQSATANWTESGCHHQQPWLPLPAATGPTTTASRQPTFRQTVTSHRIDCSLCHIIKNI